MPVGENRRHEKKWWQKRTKMKSKLIVVILVPVFLTLFFLAIFLNTDKACKTPECLKQSAFLINTMDTSVNPCDNFYQFVCGNILKKDNRNKNLFVGMHDQKEKKLLNLYKRPIEDDDHKMIKAAKRLFQKCLDVNGIEEIGLAGIKWVVDEIGGWPILSNGNSSDFDWLQAMYTLRELGFPFDVFLRVNTIRYKEEKDNYILMVDMSKTDDGNSVLKKYPRGEAVKILSDVAMMFGAQDEERVQSDVQAVYEFWQQLQSQHSGDHKEKYTIEQFQEQYNQLGDAEFDWSEFLNRITGQNISVSSADQVAFPRPDVLHDWIKLISTAPNSTVGNYMVWKVIEAQVPYMPESVQNVTKYKTNESREIFCLRECEERFPISPIDVLHTRKVFLPQRKKPIKDMYAEVKAEFLQNLQKVSWLEDDDKEVLLEKANTVRLIHELPGDYAGDEILDDLDVDWVESKAVTFLDLLAQANRNYQTLVFKEIEQSASKNAMSRYGLLHQLYPYTPIVYKISENEVYFNTEFTQFLQEDKPSYTKYPLIGWLYNTFLNISLQSFDPEFGQLDNYISQNTRREIKKMLKCLERQIQESNTTEVEIDAINGLSHGIVEAVSYKAYEKWIQVNGEEKKLPDLSYTPRQLFWIFSTYCHVPDPEIESNTLHNVHFYSNISLISKLNNPYFAKDFNCSVGTVTNPPNKCPVL